MAGNTFGTLLKLSSFGESHGEAIGGIIDGFPSNIEVDFEFIQLQLERRRPGQNVLSTPRNEKDKVIFLSGIFEGKTTGTPIAFLIYNTDKKSEDYDHLKEVFRPSHADYTYTAKYGNRDHRGSGRASARETLSRVVAGALAQIWLKHHDVSIRAYVTQIGPIKAQLHGSAFDYKAIEHNMVRCPDMEAAKEMIKLMEQTKLEGDTLGGIIQGEIIGTPAGIGEPVFDKLHAELGKAMLSINAVKGFELGKGFEAAAMKGSEHNDLMAVKDGTIQFLSNNSGGIQGGISTGENITFKVAFKPVSSIKTPQKTVDKKGQNIQIQIEGRHDVCVVPRAVPIVEGMAALVIMDFILRQKAYNNK